MVDATRYNELVGFMGWSCSEKQAALIVSLVKPSGHVKLMPDGDESGERCAESVLMQVSTHRFVRWVKLELEETTHAYTDEDIRSFLSL